MTCLIFNLRFVVYSRSIDDNQRVLLNRSLRYELTVLYEVFIFTYTCEMLHEQEEIHLCGTVYHLLSHMVH